MLFPKIRVSLGVVATEKLEVKSVPKEVLSMIARGNLRELLYTTIELLMSNFLTLIYSW